VTQFAECYLLIFGQLAVGGIAALAVPPFATIERGFYKSSAGIFLGSALLYLIGMIALVVRAGIGAASLATWIELAAWTLFTASTAFYLASLWDESHARRVAWYPRALFTGLAALVVTATTYRVDGGLGPATVLYPFAFITGALSLGAVATGMLLGHWYLIDLGLSIHPLVRLFRWFAFVTIAHVVVLLATTLLLAVIPGPGADAVRLLWEQHAGLFAARLILGPIAALGIGWMIHRTLAIPQTMAATGLFYIAILFVLVGEMLGRLVLFRTSLPL
jgi:hypothetical protein